MIPWTHMNPPQNSISIGSAQVQSYNAPVWQESSGRWRKKKARPLGRISALCTSQCFNTVGLVRERRKYGLKTGTTYHSQSHRFSSVVLKVESRTWRNSKPWRVQSSLLQWGCGGTARRRVQGQSPWSGGQGTASSWKPCSPSMTNRRSQLSPFRILHVSIVCTKFLPIKGARTQSSKDDRCRNSVLPHSALL